MKYRHEWKHEISYSDKLVLRQRLSAVAQHDPFAKNGKYLIRSLYFDNASDKALREKIDGVPIREKFRIRLYNYDTSLIQLEKKSKNNGLCHKAKATLTQEQAQAIVDGNWDWMTESNSPLVVELHSKMLGQGLRPKTIVDYTREAFVFAPGNVRITIDDDLRTGMRCTDFLNPHCVMIPPGEPPIILEVKWDEYLPDIIRDAVNLDNRQVCAFSKYAACRIYG